MPDIEYYRLLETRCEELVRLLAEHGLIGQVERWETSHPDMFRQHGEYGVWLESVYDNLVEAERLIPPPVLTLMQDLARTMDIEGSRFRRIH